ncbi:MAG: 2-amino-4-hydroxy-6-hydroxymethyldihydropteridine diphosphokinase, partial [Plesiomonas shigelloides]
MVELFIGIGSNTEREKHLNAGVAELQQIFTEVELSPVYEAEAVGVCSGNYYNLVARCKTART